MIGGVIGQGIGEIFDGNGNLPYQNIQITGLILIGSECGSCMSCGEACYDIRVVQGNDLLVRLQLKGLDGETIYPDDVTSVVWTLTDPAGQIVLVKELYDGIFIDDMINLVLEEIDLSDKSGQYTHQFLLDFNGESTATVVKDANLTPGLFVVRPSAG